MFIGNFSSLKMQQGLPQAYNHDVITREAYSNYRNLEGSDYDQQEQIEFQDDSDQQQFVQQNNYGTNQQFDLLNLFQPCMYYMVNDPTDGFCSVAEQNLRNEPIQQENNSPSNFDEQNEVSLMEHQPNAQIGSNIEMNNREYEDINSLFEGININKDNEIIVSISAQNILVFHNTSTPIRYLGKQIILTGQNTADFGLRDQLKTQASNQDQEDLEQNLLNQKINNLSIH